MIVNARMYTVSPAAGVAWRRLLAAIAERAGVDVDIIDHAPPAPISELWARPDIAAALMCGLPLSLSDPTPRIIVAPVPSPPEFRGEPHYWSEFVVRTDSPDKTLEDTLRKRIAFTTPESQSGYFAPLRHLASYAGSQPLYQAVVEPRISPLGALQAVVDGGADIAPIDAYAFHLLRRFRPDLTDLVKVVGRTDPRPIPPFVASLPVSEALAEAFLTVHEDERHAQLLSDLLLTKFVRPWPESYEVFRDEYEETVDFWRHHSLAQEIHPAFAR